MPPSRAPNASEHLEYSNSTNFVSEGCARSRVPRRASPGGWGRGAGEAESAGQARDCGGVTDAPSAGRSGGPPGSAPVACPASRVRGSSTPAHRYVSRPAGARHSLNPGNPLGRPLQRPQAPGGRLERPASASRTTGYQRAAQRAYWVYVGYGGLLRRTTRHLIEPPAVRNLLIWHD